MSLTLERAKVLRHREVLVDQHGRRWYVNGQVKRWKSDVDRIRIPLKHGLYTYGFLDNADFDPTTHTCTTYTLETES